MAPLAVKVVVCPEQIEAEEAVIVTVNAALTFTVIVPGFVAQPLRSVPLTV